MTDTVVIQGSNPTTIDVIEDGTIGVVEIVSNGPIGPQGLKGDRGSTWYHGDGPPGTIVGSLDGDFYIDDLNGDLYNKDAGVWVEGTTFIGDFGASAIAAANAASASQAAAAGSANTASTGANTATTKASEALASASAALASQNAAAASAGTAVSNAATAVTQAGIATTQAGLADEDRIAAAASALAASNSATAASGSALAASNSASAASGSAAAALASQSAALASAQAAETESDGAEDWADSAQTSAGTASTAASTATTQAGIATTQAGIATTQAGIATTQAGLADADRIAAANSAIAADLSAVAADASADAAALSETDAEAHKNLALTYLNLFRGQYLGAAAANPTLDGNGAALTVGDLYFYTITNEMRVYTGSVWAAAYVPEAGFATDTELAAAIVAHVAAGSHEQYQVRHGFEIEDGAWLATLSYNPATRVVTVTPTGGSFNVWVNGVKFNKVGAQAAPAHASSTGGHFITYNSSGNLVASTTPWSLTDSGATPVAFIYYNVALTDGVCFFELHTYERSRQLHSNLHATQGTKVVSGLAAGDFTLNVASDAAVTMSFGSGVVADEDIFRTLSGVADNGPYQIWYRETLTGEWRWGTSILPFYYGARPQYNYDAGGGTGWTRADITNNFFVNYWVFASTGVAANGQVFMVPGQQQFSTQSAAESESLADINWGTMPFQEIAPLCRLTFEGRNAFAGTGKAQLKSISRLLSGGATVSSGVSPASHSALSGRNDASSHPASAISFVPAGAIAAATVQLALEELDTEKLAAGSYTAVDVLAKLLTVDGPSSGLDADTLDGVNGAGYALAAHNQAWSTITSTPTTLAGYGISDAVGTARTISTTAPITGGGDLSANRTFAIAANGITNALAAQMAANTLKGNNSGSPANPGDLTVAQVCTMINGSVAPTWANVSGKPTTIGGFGITDFNSLGDARWSLLAHTHTFASLTSKPTTIAGYGITDYNSLGDARWVAIGTTYSFAGLTGKPTTIAGYGITDFNSLGDARWSLTGHTHTYLPLAGGTVTGTTVFEKNSQTTYNTGGVEVRSTAGDVHLGLHASGSTACSIKHIRGGNGAVVVGTDGSTTANWACAQSTATQYNISSSIALKQDISPIAPGALDRIMGVKVCEYAYKTEPEHRTVGAIAEEIYSKVSDGKSINTNALLFELLAAVQELARKVK